MVVLSSDVKFSSNLIILCHMRHRILADQISADTLKSLQWSAGYYHPQGTMGYLAQDGDIIWATDEANIKWFPM